MDATHFLKRGQVRAVLGIDAAWTPTQPSGIAVAVEKPNGWHLVAATNSYQTFHALAQRRQPNGEQLSVSSPDASSLLASASMLCDRLVDVVAIDMPLAHSSIVGRRASDDAVSRAYGGRKCGTHSPSATRPGRISDNLRESFERAGYPLCTDAIAPPCVIEVYPHPALVELSGAAMRLPYKAAKTRKYWPSASLSERRARLYRQWNEIAALLESRITGVTAALPQLKLNATGSELKAYEDTLDAVICAWVAVCCLDGKAVPYGDKNSAIWIPKLKPTAVSPH